MSIIASLYGNLYETYQCNQNGMKLLNTTNISLEFCADLGGGCCEGFIQLHRSLIDIHAMLRSEFGLPLPRCSASEMFLDGNSKVTVTASSFFYKTFYNQWLQ